MAHFGKLGLGDVDLSKCDSFWTAPLCCYDWYRSMFPDKCPDYIAALQREFPSPSIVAQGPPVPPIAYQKTDAGAVTPEQARQIVSEVTAGQNLATKADIQAFFDQLAASLAGKQTGCPWHQYKADDGTCKFPSTAVLLLGAGGILLVILARRS